MFRHHFKISQILPRFLNHMESLAIHLFFSIRKGALFLIYKVVVVTTKTFYLLLHIEDPKFQAPSPPPLAPFLLPSIYLQQLKGERGDVGLEAAVKQLSKSPKTAEKRKSNNFLSIFREKKIREIFQLELDSAKLFFFL